MTRLWSNIFSAAAILNLLGLERRRTMQARALATAGLVVAGAAVGAAAALLVAPRAGRELRAQMGQRARQLSGRIKSRGASDAADSTQDMNRRDAFERGRPTDDLSDVEGLVGEGVSGL